MSKDKYSTTAGTKGELNFEGSTVAKGVLWTSLSIAIARIASFASQFALGWWLSKGDFGTYGLAISLASIVAIMRNGGVHKILLQRNREFAQLVPKLQRVAYMFNFLACAILISVAPFLSRLFEIPQLVSLLWVIAVSIPLGTPVAILRAKLAGEGEFATVSRITIWASVVTHSSMIAFAYFGFGAMSFVLPLIICACFELVVYTTVTPARKKPTQKEVGDVFVNWRDIAWIMLGSLVLAANLRGEYVLIGWFESAPALGVYFFAFQFSIAIGALFTVSIESVLLPAFSQFAGDRAGLRAYFVSAIRSASFVSFPAILGFILILGPLVKLLWGGKWDSAIFACQVLTMMLLTRIPLSIALVALEAVGKWSSKTIILGVDGCLIMVVAGIGAWLGDVDFIAMVSGTYRLVAGLVFLVLAARLVGISSNSVLGSLLLALVAPLLAFLTVIFLTPQLVHEGGPIFEFIAVGCAFLLVTTGIGVLFFRKTWMEILRTFRKSSIRAV